uniref:Cubilin n=1 Tax=Glossina brevipalpis TaxID=37001 RepID=A0A1A9WD06_9MUSC
MSLRLKLEKLFLNLPTFLLCATIAFISISKAEYPKQPKILVNDGTLLLEAARDCNITLRLSRDALLYVNNIDVMEKIRHRYTSSSLDTESKDFDIVTTEQIKQNMLLLNDDLRSFAASLLSVQNNTRLLLQSRVLRRYLGRLRRLNGRLVAIERELLNNECTQIPEPCKNGGTCYDGYKDFYCECTEGWTGKTCEQDIDECYTLAGTELGCQNNALCVNTPGSYSCSCVKGFAGLHCRSRSVVCQSGHTFTLCGHGTCISANNNQGFTCLCDQGWSKAKGNDSALSPCTVDVNECEESRNPCHSQCINLPGSFKCSACPVGYTGNGLTCQDIDECALNNGGCSSLPKVKCINTEGSYVCGHCPRGWIGDGHTCNPVLSNSCDNENICHPRAKCQYISGVNTCTCPTGMFGHGFGAGGCHNNPTTDLCENHLCKNNGTCLVTGRGTSCLCLDGYSGALCETADACHPNPCANAALCRVMPNDKFQCSCPRGSTGKRCEIMRSVCGAILNRKTGSLRYPMDGSSGYADSERCAWIVRTDIGYILNVTFSDFDLEMAEDCSRDWLQIHDGISLAAQLIGRFCGNTLPLGGNFLSSHEQLFFWFRSDNDTNARGFNMSWTSIEHTCGETINLNLGDAGVISSPGYPGKTPIKRECEWSLNAPYGNRLVLRIYEINLGTKPNCTGDALKIYDGGVLIKSFCETAKPKPLRISSNTALIHYHTDVLRADSSFQLHYEVEAGVPNCGGIFTESSGLIISAKDQPVCLYLIQQPPGIQIKLEFLDYHYGQVANCLLHVIEVFNGKTDQDSLLLRLCSPSKPEPIVTESNYMLILHKNLLHNSESEFIFKLKYSRICNAKYFGPDSGRISTPNYPEPYFDDIICTYEIYGPANTIIVANFTDIDISESNEYFLQNKDVVDDTNRNLSSSLEGDTLTYMDVHLSSTLRKRYYKGSPMRLVSANNRMKIVFYATKNTRRARGFHVEYSFDTLPCGGVYTDNETSFDVTVQERNVIINDDNDGFVKGKLVCEWIVEAPVGRHIQLYLNYLPMGENIPLLIFGESASGQHLLFNITRERRVSEVFLYDSLTIQGLVSATYHISANVTFLNSLAECGGHFTASYGIIKSPSWPFSYPPNMACTWEIVASTGHQIELRVQNFTLENTCKGDVLEIRNGRYSSSPLIGRYCGSDIPSRITSFTNSLFVKFTSDRYIEKQGFHITWSQTTTGCGGKLTSYMGSITLPHYDYQSDYQEQCNWQIIVSQGSIIELSLFQVMCHDKYLKIYDGPSTLSPQMKFICSDFTSVSTDEKFLSSTNQVLVIYSLASSSQPFIDGHMKFILDYITKCGVIIDRVQGVIESPNFPDSYPPNQNCLWDIKGGRNNKIKLLFSHINLENDMSLSCDYDYLEIIDMENEEVLKQKRICTFQYEPIQTVGNRVKLKFVSDYSQNHGGFRVEYMRTGCSQTLVKSVGSIISPNQPYSLDLDCEWYIETNPGTKIYLTVEELYLESENNDCEEDAFIVAENKDYKFPLLKECQIEKTILKVTSPSNRMYISFRTSAKRTRKYLKAYYHSEYAECGGLYRANSGYITSPNYPANYTRSIQCFWYIRIPEAYAIELRFEDFDISKSDFCNNASLTISKMNNTQELSRRILCGMQKHSVKRIHGQEVRLMLRVNNTNSYAKFFVHYRKECGGNITDSSGYLLSKANEECVWEVSLPEGSQLSVNILQLDCYCKKSNPNASNCDDGLGFTGNYFEEIDTGNFSFQYCEQHLSNLIFNGPKVYVVARGINFHAGYDLTQNSCGGSLTSLRGSLVSPGYPNSYPGDVECIWEIQAAKGNSIVLNFLDVDLATSEFCNQDFIEVRRSATDSLIGLYCGKQYPESMIQVYDKVLIRFRSATGSTGNGFKMAWSHNNEFINQTKGTIEALPLKAARNEEEGFSWRVLVPRETYISLEFLQYTGGLKLFDGYDNTGLQVEIPSLFPWRFVSSTNVLFLQTVNMELEYFLLNWTTIEHKPLSQNATNSKCFADQFLISPARVNVSSPGYPHGYENDLNCQWIYKPELSTEHVVLALYQVKLEISDKCNVDYLRVSTSVDLEQWHSEIRICNSTDEIWKPFKIIHGRPYLKLEFVTDLSVNLTGFTSLVYTQCGSNLTDTVGFIPFRIHWYMTMRRICEWRISVKPGKRVNLQFDFPSNVLQNDRDCRSYALIYDGIDDHAPLLKPGKICSRQNSTRLLMQSSTRHVMIKYNVNRTMGVPLLLWNLTYREFSECNAEIKLTHEASSVNITTPRYPDVPNPYTDCNWIVIAPVGETLKIEFLDHFSMNVRYCNKEYVEMFDGSTELSPRIGRFCTRPSEKRTTGNLLLIHYITNIAEPRNGFRARLSLNKCGGTFTDARGYITSSGYPATDAYPAYSQCDYYLRSPVGEVMKLEMEDLNIPYNSTDNKNSDYLEIADLNNVTLNANMTYIYLYGNVTELPVYVIDSSLIRIRFHTFKKATNFRGFKMSYSRYANRQSCNYYMYFREARFLINFNKPSSSGVTCRWKINVPKGQRIKLEFLNLQDLKDQSLIRSPRFSVYNDFDSISEIINFDANTYNANYTIQSSDNTMLLKVFTPYIQSSLKPITARYSSHNLSICPRDIGEGDEDGEISLSDSEPEFNTNYYCRIRIRLNGQETMILTLKALYVHSERNHLYPLTIRDSTGLTLYQENITDIAIPMQMSSDGIAAIIIFSSRFVSLHKLIMQYRRFPCGSVMELNNDAIINYPQFSASDASEIVCVWTLRKYFREDSLEYRLIGNFSFSDSCDEEYVEIFVGALRKSKPALRICRDNAAEFESFPLKNRLNHVTYNSQNFKAQANSFRIRVTRDLGCGSKSIVMSNQQLAVSKDTYKNNEECLWEFYTLPGYYFKLNFNGRFFIEDSVNCTKDYLEIQRFAEGLWLPEIRLCGREVYSQYNLTANEIQIIFHTDKAITGDGFTLEVQADCLVAFNVTSEVQTVKNPPSVNGANSGHCEYTFFAAKKDQLFSVRIFMEEDSPSHISRFELQNKCRLGYFVPFKKFENQTEKTEDRRCMGDFELRSYQYLRLSYEALTFMKFRIEFSYDNCGGNITHPSVIRSLKHETENTYANNMNCIWYITAPPEHSIAIRFKYFITEERYDYVSIYTGPSIQTDKMLSKLTGDHTKNPPTIVVDRNQAVVTAVSDSSSSKEGFEAKIVFLTNCNERITLTDGNSPVTLTRDFKFNATTEYLCHYRITAPKGYQVRIDVRRIQLNGLDTDCNLPAAKCSAQCNYIEIFDGISNAKASMSKFCSAFTTNRTLISSMEDVFMELNARFTGQYSFEIILSMEKSICGDFLNYEFGESEKLTLTFPPHSVESDKYPPNTHCHWRFKTKNFLKIHIDYLHLQNTSQVTGKCVDYVQFKGYLVSPSVGFNINLKNLNFFSTYQSSTVLCGHVNDFNLTLSKTRNSISEIIFHSDESMEDRGFQLTATQKESCNITYSELNGMVVYNNLRFSEKFCEDIIRVPDTHNLNLYLPPMIFKNNDCTQVHLKVLDFYTNRTLLEQCGNEYGYKRLNTNTSAVRLLVGEFIAVHISYVASDRTLPPGCGGKLQTTTGLFANPSYNERNFSDCRWEIEVPAPNFVKIFFPQFNMGTITNCQWDYVQIIDILPDGTEKLKNTYCGSDRPDHQRSMSNRVAIIAKKSPNFDGTGWIIGYDLNSSDNLNELMGNEGIRFDDPFG